MIGDDALKLNKMKKIESRLSAENESNCFGCSPRNPKGLKMKFFEDEDEVVCFWDPEWYYDGWNGILHGGVSASLLDELGEWLVFSKLDTAGVTTDLNVKYKKPVITTEGKIEIRGKIIRQIKNLVIVEAWILNKNNERCVEANIRYFTYSKSVAKEKFDFKS